MSEQSLPPDDGSVEEIVRAALEAFLEDPSYAVAVSKAANATVAKREVWKARADLEMSEAKAMIACEQEKPFHCRVISPCGTGDCPFAQGDLKGFKKEFRGTSFRPQLNNTGSYSLEDAARYLREWRKKRLNIL